MKIIMIIKNKTTNTNTMHYRLTTKLIVFKVLLLVFYYFSGSDI